MITYRLDATAVHAHLFHVVLEVPNPAAEQRLSLPVWIPGSYLVREFARHLSALTASQGDCAVPLEQLDKATWLARCGSGQTLTVRYAVYAFDTSVRAAYLDAGRGFFNGTGVCLRVEGREREPHLLELTALPPGWDVATALLPSPPAADGRPVWRAADYHELVDSPVELGCFQRLGFEAAGVPHELVVTGAWPDFDAARLVADTRRICEAEIAFWHGVDEPPPFERYVFLLNAVDDGRGGLEHRASTALIAARRDLPPLGLTDVPDSYVGLLGLVSHEYFHTWNVKRLKPAEFAALDYTRENYTRLLWFFEGFTSYYDDLFLVRAGLIDAARYLGLVGRTLSGVLAAPGRKVQSVAQASFDAWVKYYRADENTPNATISYYTKGSLVALALDLTLRAEGRGTLDDVMRALWRTSRGGPIDEAAIAAALAEVSGRSFAAELAAWVHGTDDLPLPPLLARFGIAWQHPPASLAQRLGLRVAESALTGVKVSQVLRGGAAEAAGLAAGDELLAVDGWRLRRLDDAQRLLRPGMPAALLAARDQRLLNLTLALPEAAGTGAAVSLQIDPAPDAAALALQKAWLAG